MGVSLDAGTDRCLRFFARGGATACAHAPISQSMRVLIIEDDAATADYVVKGLREQGHVVEHAANGTDGLHRAAAEPFDVLVVDRMLPGRDGLAVVKLLRAAGNDTPVLVLSALDRVDDRVTGLRAGGDDYLTKPFAFAELVARIEVLGRRRSAGGSTPDTRLQVGDLTIDRMARRVTRADQTLDLQPREYALLECLARHAGQVVTRTMLLEQVWDYHFDPQTNVIDVHIARLRSKVDKPFDRPLIHTVRGAGYVLRA